MKTSFDEIVVNIHIEPVITLPKSVWDKWKKGRTFDRLPMKSEVAGSGLERDQTGHLQVDGEGFEEAAEPEPLLTKRKKCERRY